MTHGLCLFANLERGMGHFYFYFFVSINTILTLICFLLSFHSWFSTHESANEIQMSDKKTISSPTHLVDQVSQRLGKKESGEIPRMAETSDFSVFSETRGQQGGGDSLEMKLMKQIKILGGKVEKKLSDYQLPWALTRPSMSQIQHCYWKITLSITNGNSGSEIKKQCEVNYWIVCFLGCAVSGSQSIQRLNKPERRMVTFSPGFLWMIICSISQL